MGLGIIIMDSFPTFFGSQEITALVLGVFLFIICVAIVRMEIIHALSITFIPYIFTSIYLDKSFGWFIGVVVLIYGIELYMGFKNFFISK